MSVLGLRVRRGPSSHSHGGVKTQTHTTYRWQSDPLAAADSCNKQAHQAQNKGDCDADQGAGAADGQRMRNFLLQAFNALGRFCDFLDLPSWRQGQQKASTRVKLLGLKLRLIEM
ncbi:unnamed protein product [Symbiodinium natans]|uniref:Uncharacterized protein n=1 Tax=Symbiodinium natans TaxID=878477 RepID=A0A812IDV7_9DINO|nr:unnamed protein product [Symbiodinium natans]